MIQSKKCPEGADCPYKASKAREAIRSMPNHLKWQEQANMKPIDVKEINALAKEELIKYQRTGLTPKEITELLKCLHGECWLCEHSKPYDVGTSRKLSVCELGYPDQKESNAKPIAMIRDKQCSKWKLKHLARE